VIAGRRAGSSFEVSLTLRHGQAKEARLNGARLPSADSLRRELQTLVFTPDRLAVVKGGPAARRAYFDRVLARLFPARTGVPQEYLSALAQRNAALRRVQLGLAATDVIEPWSDRVATAGAELVAARQAALELLAVPFADRAGELGLPDAQLRYEGDPPSLAELESRLQRDVDRGTTGIGPHLHDVLITSSGRDLRQFGSQGEQRLSVLSLLLAEAELLPEPPLLLLDDVLSELDLGRRRVLADRVAGMGQTVITATHPGALPVEPAQLVEVELGSAR
jgi:DNA replication and repair protein RecF